MFRSILESQIDIGLLMKKMREVGTVSRPESSEAMSAVLGVLRHPRWGERMEAWGQVLDSVRTGLPVDPFFERISEIEDQIFEEVPGVYIGENSAAVRYCMEMIRRVREER